MTKEEATKIITNDHIVHALFAYLLNTGIPVEELKNKLWSKKLDECWTIKMNGSVDQVIDGIQPASWYIEFNGWPAGCLFANGDGWFSDGEAANESALRAVLLKKVNE